MLSLRIFVVSTFHYLQVQLPVLQFSLLLNADVPDWHGGSIIQLYKKDKVQIKAFSYNPNTQYQPSAVYNTKDQDIINQTTEVKKASSDSQSHLKVKLPDISAKYVLPWLKAMPLSKTSMYI